MAPAHVAGGLFVFAAAIAGAVYLVNGVYEPADGRARPAPTVPTAEARRPEPVAPPDERRPFLDPGAAGVIAYGSGDHDGALAQFQAAVEKNPEDAEAWSNLGQVLVRLGRVEEALPHFDRAIALHATRWAYHFNRARALGLLQRWDEAVAGYVTAQSLFPDDYATAFNLAQAYHRAGDEASAVVQYRRAIDLNPEDPTFHLALGISCERLDRRQEAAAAYAEYLRLDPDAGDAERVRDRIALLSGADPAGQDPR